MSSSGLPIPRRYWALFAITLGVFVAVMATNVVNVALPTIARSFDASPSAAVWIVTANQLAISASLFPLAALGERVGYRHVYCAGLAVCVCASFACAMSQSLWQITLARAVQGFGISAVMAVNLALLRFIFPRHLIGLGIGYSTFAVAVFSTAGPTIAGGIMAVAGWPWLFLIEVPIGLLVLPIAILALPNPPRSSRSFDTSGALLSGVTFALVIVTVDASGRGLAAWASILLAATCALLIIILVRHQKRQPYPMLPLDLLSIPILRLSMLTAASSYVVQGLCFVALPFYFHDVLGLSPGWVGLVMAPWPLGVALAAPVGGWLTGRYPPGLLCTIGLAILVVGLILMLALPEEPGVVNVAWRMLVCGLGFGTFQSPNSVAIMSRAPADRSGSAGAIQSAARLFGQTFGVTIAAVTLGLAALNATTMALTCSIIFASLAAAFSAMRGFSPPEAR